MKSSSLGLEKFDLGDKDKSLNNDDGDVASMMDDEDSGRAIRCVLFKLDTELYGLDVQKVREVLKVGEIREVPGSQYDVLGIINVRGVIVTVVDVRQSFKLSPAEINEFSRIIIIELTVDRVVGLLVDVVMEVRDIPESKIEPASSQSLDDNVKYIQGIAHVYDNVIILVDADHLFKDSDWNG